MKFYLVVVATFVGLCFSHSAATQESCAEVLASDTSTASKWTQIDQLKNLSDRKFCLKQLQADLDAAVEKATADNYKASVLTPDNLQDVVVTLDIDPSVKLRVSPDAQQDMDDNELIVIAAEIKEIAEKNKKKAELEAAENGNRIADLDAKMNFAALGFGLGLGYSFGVDGDRVESAEVINGVVRVTSDNTDQARVLAEAHWFFTPFHSDNIGVGPFASINTGGSSDAISSFGLGLMVGFRDANNSSRKSWNLGVGYIADSNVQVLGDGIEANQPLPAGEESVRFKKESKGAIVIMFSRGFGF